MWYILYNIIYKLHLSKAEKIKVKIALISSVISRMFFETLLDFAI